MRAFSYILLIFYITSGNCSIYSNIKDNVLSFFRSFDNGNDIQTQNDVQENIQWDAKDVEDGIHDKGQYDWDLDEPTNPLTKPGVRSSYLSHLEDAKDVKEANQKAKILSLAKAHEDNLNKIKELNMPKNSFPVAKERYHMDPVLNMMRRRNFRKKMDSETNSDSSSSSREMKDWKQEWREFYLSKKMEAINATVPTGDVINMVAARPWGIPCGDPNQHDMPWGTCMLAPECESEYRIYRGDLFCGRSGFICCALMQTTYDLYQALDVSFDDKSLSTDTDEKKTSGKSSDEKSKKKRKRERRKRKRDRQKRKRDIRRKIRRIVREMRKLLNRLYRNGTSEKKRKTKQLKKFIKNLKKQYQKDRQSVKEIHADEIVKIDSKLAKRLDQIKSMNDNFMMNATFRDIVVNGTISRAGARMLLEAYPELADVLLARREGTDVMPPLKPKDYLEYDVEYGYLYY